METLCLPAIHLMMEEVEAIKTCQWGLEDLECHQVAQVWALEE